MSDVLNSLRTLLSTATNETLLDRLFSFPRKSVQGTSIPNWLLESEEVLLEQFSAEPFIWSMNGIDDIASDCIEKGFPCEQPSGAAIHSQSTTRSMNVIL
ncbi:hypothetical protein GJ496_010028 [Pomphorhynchus laevis]|nr:hypothetical protein GJ496_010028 [Pomphorhynchus laevis]